MREGTKIESCNERRYGERRRYDCSRLHEEKVVLSSIL